MEEIKYLRRGEIDLSRYDRTVVQSGQGLPYAESWFLDALTKGNWKTIVQGDWDVVMPVPLKRSPKYLFKNIIAQPILCQQLGLYRAVEAEESDFAGVYEKLYLLHPLAYSFNFSNNPPTPPAGLKLKEMPNYVLALDKPYEELSGAYSSNHRRNIRKAAKIGLSFEISHEISGESDLMQLKRSTLRRRVMKIFKKPAQRLMWAALERGRGFFARVFLEDKLLSTVFFISTSSRLIYLIAANHPAGKSMGASHFLVDEIVKKWAGSKMTLDFEGSHIPGVARFFSMFGSVNEPFYHLGK